MNLLQLYAQLVTALIKLRDSLKAQQPMPANPQQSEPQSPVPNAIAPDPLNPDVMSPDWANPVLARHNVRVMCDLAGLDFYDKSVISACIEVESGFNIRAIHKNTNGSTDYGIVQMNSTYWVGPGKFFASPEEVYDDPQKSVQFMIDKYKAGHITLWMSYTTGMYRKYMP